MADSEGTWEFGTTSAATIAASDFGQWSPASDPDLWADAALSAPAVVFRALKRAALQTSALADGTRSFSFGVMLGDSKMLTPGDSAAEVALDGVRVRRPVEIRCTYDGGATTGVLYPRLATGSGFDASLEIESAIIVGAAAMRLVTAVINCVAGTPGLTDIRLETVSSVEIATVTGIDLANGVNTVDFLIEAGAHSIAAGEVVALYLDTTAAHAAISLLLLFEEVPT